MFGGKLAVFWKGRDLEVGDVSAKLAVVEGSNLNPKKMNSAVRNYLSVLFSIIFVILCCLQMSTAAPAKTANLDQEKRAFDSLVSPSFTGMDKRAFDSFTGAGFTGFDKRAFDSFTGPGFTGFDKRAFDSFTGPGFTGFDKKKRAFDNLMGSGFTGFDRRRRAFDMLYSPSFTGMDKRAFDSLVGSFSGMDKRAFDSLTGSGFTGFE
uniref:Uncharacterized protein n=1 Tax=Panagrolaimus sp. JU765 TaxID=591449 RepID=A0AC34QQE5_9BILA